MTLWQIEGYASDGADAFAVSLQTTTPAAAEPPDHRKALATVHPGWEWTSVPSVEAAATLPEAWDARDGVAEGLFTAARTLDHYRRVSDLDTRVDE